MKRRNYIILNLRKLGHRLYRLIFWKVCFQPNQDFKKLEFLREFIKYILQLFYRLWYMSNEDTVNFLCL